MYDISKFRKDRYELEDIIDRWVFDEETRAILKRKLFDNISFERLAEEIGVSTKTVQNKYYKGVQTMIDHIDDKKYSKAWKFSFIRPSATDRDTTYVCLFGKRYIFRKGFGCVGSYKA